ncbi:MAG TPA: hypothetical protein VIE43_21895 [Thermoanaerobaculia bacterium]|jgi:hypothetical protein|nr:hypothetical protein [Thermoanaerobaculia bacterium]
MRSNVLRAATLGLLILIGSALAWGADAPGGDRTAGIVKPDEAEAESLCAEIVQSGWEGITLERALDLVPTLRENIETAADAGLLRGFLAVALQDTTCAEPPADVLGEALRYLDRSVELRDTVVVDMASLPDYIRCFPLRTYPEGEGPAPRDPQEILRGLPDPLPPRER